MPVLAVGNEVVDFRLITPGVDISTSTSVRNTTQSRVAFGCTTIDYVVLDFASATSSVWIRGFLRTSTSIITDVTVLTLRSATSDVFRLQRVGSNSFLTFQAWTGSAWTNLFTTDLLPPLGYLMPFYLRVTTGSSGQVFVQFGNPAQVSGSFSGNTVYTGTLAAARFLALNSSAVSYWSGIIVADENCFGWSVCPLTPNAAGDVNDWGGSASDVNSPNDPYSTWIQTASTNQRVVFNASDIPSAFAGLQVAAVVLASATRRGVGATPTNIRHTLRIGGTNYDSGNLNPSEFITHRQTIHNTNPATNQPWTQSEVNGLQIGVVSV